MLAPNVDRDDGGCVKFPRGSFGPLDPRPGSKAGPGQREPTPFHSGYMRLPGRDWCGPVHTTKTRWSVNTIRTGPQPRLATNAVGISPTISSRTVKGGDGEGAKGEPHDGQKAAPGIEGASQPGHSGPLHGVRSPGLKH